ncbi:MAG: hypothetical protein WBD53_09625 [Xanthobacteraceae bacterium]
MGIKPLPDLDERLSQKERIFRAPPLTPEIISAIKLISPHCDLGQSDRYRTAWEADQNGACWGEYEALEPILKSVLPGGNVLEIGPGMGRSIVFFSKMLGLPGDSFHAYEGTGTTTKYTFLGPKFADSFCGNISVLKHLLEFNGVSGVTIFDAAQVALSDLPGPYDLIYSFYSIGFHWSLEHFIGELLPLLSQHGIGIFTTTLDFTPFEKLTELSYRILDWTPAWPLGARAKFIVLSKGELPLPL